MKAKTRMVAKINNTGLSISHFSNWMQEDLPEMASQEKPGSKATTNYQNLNFGKSLYQHYLEAEDHAFLRITSLVEAIWIFVNPHATKVVARVYQATTSSYNKLKMPSKPTSWYTMHTSKLRWFSTKNNLCYILYINLAINSPWDRLSCDPFSCKACLNHALFLNA